MQNLSEVLKAYFDIEYDKKIGNFQFDLFARFNSRNSRFFLSKKIEIYSFETSECILYKNLKQNVDIEFLKSLKDFLNRNVRKIVDIKGNHMSSTLTFIFTGNFKLDKDMEKTISKFNYYKSFKLGFKGWVNVRTYFINPSESFVYSNKYGKKDKKKFLLKDSLRNGAI
jgi:hypothetical protein